MNLEWFPQEAYADFFLTDTKDIIKHRSVFRPDIEYFVMYGGRGSAKTFSAITLPKIDGFSKYGLCFTRSKTFSGNVTQTLLNKSMAEKISMSIIISS